MSFFSSRQSISMASRNKLQNNYDKRKTAMEQPQRISLTNMHQDTEVKNAKTKKSDEFTSFSSVGDLEEVNPSVPLQGGLHHYPSVNALPGQRRSLISPGLPSDQSRRHSSYSEDVQNLAKVLSKCTDGIAEEEREETSENDSECSEKSNARSLHDNLESMN